MVLILGNEADIRNAKLKLLYLIKQAYETSPNTGTMTFIIKTIHFLDQLQFP